MPRDIDDAEILIRAVTSWHFRNGQLDLALFKDNEKDEMSVSRKQWVSPWLAKLIAKGRIQNSHVKPPNIYVGLAFLPTAAVRSLGSIVVDTRAEYLGHADISHGIYKRAPGEAVPAKVAKKINDRAKAIRAASQFVLDPKPGSFMWPASYK